MKSVLEYIDYQKFLNDWINSRPRKGRGIKSNLAEYLGITPAHVSRILNEAYHLTLDQAAKLIVYLELSEIEGNYFLSLVEMARAGSPELQEKVQERLDKCMEDWKTMARAELKKEELLKEDMETYFSSYLYSSIELLIGLKDYQTPDAISTYFNIPKKKVMEILGLLLKTGILEKNGDLYQYTGASKWNDLPKNLKKMNNLNWRHRAIASLEYDQIVDFHKNMQFSIESKSIPNIKKDLLNFINFFIDKYFKEKVKAEDEEEKICSICIDFFEIK